MLETTAESSWLTGRVFSAFKDGQRWQWFVWENMEALWEGELKARGEVDSHDECHAVRASHSARTVPAKFARSYLRRKAAERRQSRAAPHDGGAAVPEFLFSWFESYDDGHTAWFPHRVVKRTRRFVYVERRTWDGHRAKRPPTWEDYAEKCYRLSAVALDRAGCVMVRPGLQTFYTEAGRERFERERRERQERHGAPCFAALGLTSAATLIEVKRAYRSLAQVNHPDAGGDAAAFVSLTKHYEQALAFASASAGREAWILRQRKSEATGRQAGPESVRRTRAFAHVGGQSLIRP